MFIETGVINSKAIDINLHKDFQKDQAKDFLIYNLEYKIENQERENTIKSIIETIKTLSVEEESIGKYTNYYVYDKKTAEKIGYVKTKTGYDHIDETYLYDKHRKKLLSIPLICSVMLYCKNNHKTLYSDNRTNKIISTYQTMEKLGIVLSNGKKTIDQKNEIYSINNIAIPIDNQFL